MSTFKDLQKGYENQFVHQQEIQFKLITRRNRLIAEWAADQLDLNNEARTRYILGLLVCDEEELAHKLVENFKDQDLENLIPEIKNQIELAQKQALAEWQKNNTSTD